MRRYVEGILRYRFFLIGLTGLITGGLQITALIAKPEIER
jgi:hypothetical protein